MNAHGIKRTGPAIVKGLHLCSANEVPETCPPSKTQRWKDKDWKYTPARDTDIRVLFKRIRRELKQEKK